VKQPFREAAWVALLAALAWVGPLLAGPRARPVVLNLGPNDVEYVSGFREDWERDRRTRFHWTTLFATVRLPVHLEGPGHVLRMRVRRHFLDPAIVTVRAEGRTVGRFEIQADPHLPYRVVELPLPPLEGRDPLVLTLQSSVTTPRPLGVAIDWMEVVRAGGDARVRLPVGVRFALMVVVLLAYALPRVAGAGLVPSRLHSGVVALAVTLGTWWDVLATERIARLGAPVYVAVGLVAWLLVSLAPVRRALDLGDAASARRLAGGLVLVVLAALAVRLALLLHPQFYYPDVKVHALFAWQLARRGLVTFLQEFTANQFRYSLGLQNEGGHWYAFPYPPAFYILTWPLVRLASMRPEVAVSVLGAAVNSLEALVVFGIARRLGSRPPAALASAGALVLLPIFLRRLSLAYFPALVGHAVDAIVIAYLLARLADLARLRVIVTLAVLFAIAMLTYTQSVLNFAVLLGLFLLVQAFRDRTPGAWRRIFGLILAGLLSGVFALAVFYGRYVPIFIDMHRGIPMPEERILHEKPASPVVEEVVPEPPDDPYAGPGVDPVRGLKKAVSRLVVFYEWFTPVVIAGLLLVWRRTQGDLARFTAVWALTYVVLNLLSGGLPGPNLVRYNKDLEIVAPLFCVALAEVGAWLWARARALGIVYALAYVAFGAVRWYRDLTDRFILER
jgi:hypothetical protein